jgi:uncharacterized membrane protein YdjX (TVP38/TMEM64 family)
LTGGRRQQQEVQQATQRGKTDRPITIDIDDTMAAKTRVFRPAYIAVAALLCHPTSCCARRIESASISLDRTRLLVSSRRDEHEANVIQRITFIHGYKHKAPLDSTPLNRDIIGQLRGGAISNRQTKSLNEQKPSQSNNILTITSIAVVLLTVLFSVLNWETLVLSLSSFFDREKFRRSILDTLNSISAKGTRGLLLYTFGFIFWETCGLPTSVVETAAGMAFGFSNALLCSFVGKTLGSILAFTLGRSLCHSFVKKQLQDNEVLELMEKSVARNPIRSALIMRYSPFPQLIKNFGLSMTEPVTLPVFLLAICVHGFPFSILWAALGQDSSLRLRADEMGESLDANWVLNGALVFVTVFGFVISPVITGWWLAGLKKDDAKSN